MENALQAHPDLNAVYAATDGLLPPVFSALEAADKLKKVGEPGHVIVMSIDGDPQGCAAVRDGVMDAGIAAGENPKSGRQAIEAIIKIKETGEPLPDEERIIMNEGYLYTPENLQDVESLVWGCIIGGE
jgi:ABC-type sugar transport system substrate-binding protein